MDWLVNFIVGVIVCVWGALILGTLRRIHDRLQEANIQRHRLAERDRKPLEDA